jgi:ABC-2 type transport system permease protein
MIGIIIRREYLTRVRRRAFLLGTLLGPVIVAAVMGVAIWAGVESEKPIKVMVVDRGGLVTHWDSVRQAWLPNCPDCFPERAGLDYRFSDQPMGEEDFLASDFGAMLEFDDGVLQHGKVLMYYDEVPSMTAQNRLQRDLSEAIERFRVKEESGLDYATYKRLKTDVALVGQDVVTRAGEANGRAAIGFAFSLLLFLQITMYGMQVMRGVVEEKSNRIVEVIISSVKPWEWMAGKVIGIGLVGLTQILGFILLGTAAVVLGGNWLESSGALAPGGMMGLEDPAVGLDWQTWVASQSELSFLLDVNWGWMIVATVFFYVVGFGLYAALFAAVGASVEQESDAQYLLMPVMAPLTASYVLASMALQNPEGTLAVVGSMVPFTAPVMMLMRLPVGVPFWQLAVSGLGTLVMAWILLVLAGRIYRTGLLMYGKRPTLREMFRWLFYKG